MVAKGEAEFHSATPFANAIKKQQLVQKFGAQIVVSDLLGVSLKKGSSLWF